MMLKASLSLVSLFCAAGASLAQTTFVAGDVGTGLGMFQDIQVPVNEEAGTRADGTVAQTENATHSGFPIWAGLGVVHYRGALALDAGFDVMQMRASTGPAETQSSSYGRLEAGAGAKYSLPIGETSRIVIGGKALARRSAFMNVSSGHFIQSVMVRGSLGWATPARVIEAYAAMAPSARFGYDKGGGFGFGGDAFRASTATLSEIGASAAFLLRDRVWIDLGLEQESARVTIDDVVSEYAGFGLLVSRQRVPSRTYDLATAVVRIGVRKEF